MRKEQISININKDVLNILDNYVKNIGMGANRSCFIEEAVVYYLNFKEVENANITKNN